LGLLGLDHHLIDITPDPVLSRLERLYEWVVSRVEVLGGVLVLRRITAAYMPTGETQPQVDPAVPCLQTVFTSIGAWRDILNLVEMRTLLCHVFLSFLTYALDSNHLS
jgi:hypothetical protein